MRNNFESYRRFMWLVAGLEQSGKTFFIQKFADKYAREKGPVIAYNAGRDEDFSDYEWIEPIEPHQMAETFGWSRKKEIRFKQRPQITHFRYHGKIYHFRDFNLMFANRGEGAKRLKMFAINDSKDQSLFLKALFLYVSNCFLILDDCRVMTRGGLPRDMLNLFARKNHTGSRAAWKAEGSEFIGIDIAAIYHNLDKITPEMYDYATSLIMFKCNQKPGRAGIENDAAREVIFQAYTELESAKPYTAIKINLRGRQRMSANLIRPQMTANL